MSIFFVRKREREKNWEERGIERKRKQENKRWKGEKGEEVEEREVKKVGEKIENICRLKISVDFLQNWCLRKLNFSKFIWKQFNRKKLRISESNSNQTWNHFGWCFYSNLVKRIDINFICNKYWFSVMLFDNKI